MSREPTTEAGRRLLWFFQTERMPNGRRVPAAFDARLTERIVEEFVVRIEDEARQPPTERKP